MLRRSIAIAVAVVLIAGAGVAYAAASGDHTRVNCLDTVWRTNAASTSSTAFTRVPGLTDSPASIFPMAVTVSAQLSGAPVEFRVRTTNVGDQTTTARPGRVRSVPDGGGPDAFSFQWIEPDGSAAVHVNDVHLEWRSPSGQPVTMDRGDLSVLYETEAGACRSV
jgi:hypothetical protein